MLKRKQTHTKTDELCDQLTSFDGSTGLGVFLCVLSVSMLGVWNGHWSQVTDSILGVGRCRPHYLKGAKVYYEEDGKVLGIRHWKDSG